MSFRDLEIDEQEISHYLCKTHLKRTLKRKLVDSRCKKLYEHLYATLYYRKINLDCEDSIKRAMDVASNKEKRDYIERE